MNNNITGEYHELHRNLYKNNFLYYFSIFCIFFITLILIVFAFIEFWPVEISKPNIQPYRILTPVVKIGGSLTYEVDACKFSDLTAIVSRVFVNEDTGEHYPALMSSSSVPKGCHKTNAVIPVPSYLVPGHYHIMLNVDFELNPIRHKIYNYTVASFKVI